MIKALLETDPNSSQLLALLNCFEVSPRSLELIPKLLDNKGCAKVLLKKLNHHMYGAADNTFKKQLFHLMIDSAVECKIPEVHWYFTVSTFINFVITKTSSLIS